MSRVKRRDSQYCLLEALQCGSCPTVEHLEFRDSYFYPKDLQAMVAACSNLKTFVYDVMENY